MRKFFAIALFIPILLVFVIATTAQVVKSSFLEAAPYKQLLVQHDVYGKIDEFASREIEKGGAQMFAQIPILKSEDLVRAFRATFPAFFWQETLEGTLDQFFAWIRMKDSSLSLLVSLERPKEVFPNVARDILDQRFQELPVCAGQIGKDVSIPVCRLSSWKSWEDIFSVLPKDAPIKSTFIEDIVQTIPNHADLVAIAYNLELQSLKEKNNATGIPSLTADENGVLSFLFQPILPGGEPQFLKGLRQARSVVQIVLSALPYLWFGLGVLLLIFVLLVKNSLASTFRWIGSLFLFLGGIFLAIAYGLRELASSFLQPSLFEGKEIPADVSALVFGLIHDAADGVFIPLKIIAAGVLILSLLLFLVSMFVPHSREQSEIKRSFRLKMTKPLK